MDASVLPRDAVIAIDGPAGSGKSTTAKALAEKFDLLYIDSGAMYRALTAVALVAGADLDDEAALLELCHGAELGLRPGQGEVAVSWNGKDISRDIRTPEVDQNVSVVAAHPGVRADMVARQQEMGRQGGVVMEGRDIGSVVFSPGHGQDLPACQPGGAHRAPFSAEQAAGPSDGPGRDQAGPGRPGRAGQPAGNRSPDGQPRRLRHRQ